MKSVTYLLLGVCLSLVGFFGYLTFNQTSSAQKVARNQWEYAAITAIYSFNPYRDRVNKIYGMAEICYLQNNGCKRLPRLFNRSHFKRLHKNSTPSF